LKEQQTGFEEFFALDPAAWSEIYGLSEEDVRKLVGLAGELPNYSFLTESLLDQGYRIIPLNSPDYSATLKNHLKFKYSPPVLYIKGNREILDQGSVAIVGSRYTGPVSLEFTEARARIAAENGQVVVSGFAPGVDRLALDTALKHKGKSIIVLPQGITTFVSGFREYYQQIIEGDVLVLSTFHPNARWTAGLAMARNPIIYGLADEIYVADCQEKGGTWSGAMDGIRKGRTIYVRAPAPGEKSTIKLLIDKGAIPIEPEYKVKHEDATTVREEKPDYQSDQKARAVKSTQPRLL
jgi:predicted Rossmann fold nucleotide-binding protein DprA/Smf involved in DNA uptake